MSKSKSQKNSDNQIPNQERARKNEEKTQDEANKRSSFSEDIIIALFKTAVVEVLKALWSYFVGG